MIDEAISNELLRLFGELPLALVTERTPVFAMVIGLTATKTLGNVKEVEARGAPVVAVTDAPTAASQYLVG